MDKYLISIHNVHKSFPPKCVLNDFSLHVRQGESCVILGRSGTGKSVMLKCIVGLLNIDQGDILIDNTSIVSADQTTVKKIRNQIGMLFQGSALFDSFPVWENIFFKPLQNKTITRQEAREQSIALLEQVGMEAHVFDLYPSELSGGMQRRVALARAIATKPKIVLFDEPTTGLDPIVGGMINQLIRSCVERIGATAITITHDLASCRAIGDRVGLMHQGKLIWEGDVTEIDHNSNTALKQFIQGNPQGPLTLKQE